LDDLLGDRPVADVHTCEPDQRGVVAIDERLERPFVTLAERLDDEHVLARGDCGGRHA
jgi:hypothetical protein